jgi:antimicrobial peptide system SdpB family protein
MRLKVKLFPNSIMFTYSLGRTLITLSLLITLIFNSNSVIFSTYAIENFKLMDGINWMKEANFFLIFGDSNVHVSKFIAICVLTVSLLGFFPKITGLLLFYFANSFLNLAAISEGGDVISSNLSFMLLPIVLMDNRKFLYDFTRNIFDTDLKKIIANNVFWIIQIQISFLYLNSCMGKLYVDEWVNGTALYYYMDSTVYGFGVSEGFIKEILCWPFFVITGTWGALVIEFLLFTCLFITDIRKKEQMFWVGILFHFIIILMFGLVTFFLSICAGLVLFLTFKKEKINYDA